MGTNCCCCNEPLTASLINEIDTTYSDNPVDLKIFKFPEISFDVYELVQNKITEMTI